jgi:hypothetical protein
MTEPVDDPTVYTTETPSHVPTRTPTPPNVVALPDQRTPTSPRFGDADTDDGDDADEPGRGVQPPTTTTTERTTTTTAGEDGDT